MSSRFGNPGTRTTELASHISFYTHIRGFRGHRGGFMGHRRDSGDTEGIQGTQKGFM